MIFHFFIYIVKLFAKTKNQLNNIVKTLLKLVEKLSVCGLESCNSLLESGYADIGWNPLEGERYLDFLKNTVFVNGKLSQGLEHQYLSKTYVNLITCKLLNK